MAALLTGSVASSETPRVADAPVAGQAVAIRLSHFKHDRWTPSEGAPSNIGAIAQTGDGYLWLGNNEGLWRFDGVTFERVAAPDGSAMVDAGVNSLRVTARGELWVGFSDGAGVAVYRDGRLVDMKMPSPPPVVVQIVEGTDGAIWAQWGGISERLWRYQQGRWQLVDTTLGLPTGFLLTMMRTRDGHLKLPVLSADQRSTGIADLAPGATRFTWLGGAFDFPRLAQDPQGNLWVADGHGTRILQSAGKSAPPTPIYPALHEVRLPMVAFDRWGGLWKTTQSGGIERIAAAAQPGGSPTERIDAFSAIDGLSSDVSKQAFTDREGNVWITTEGGLDRFRYADIVREPSIPADLRGIGITGMRDGSVAVVSKRMLYHIAPGQPPRLAMRGVDFEALCPARNGAVWVVGKDDVRQIGAESDKARFGVPPTTGMALGCAEDDRNRFWLQAVDRSAWWHDAGGWHHAPTAKASALGQGIVANDDGVAFGTGRTAFAVATGNRILRFDVSRLGIGEVKSINAAQHGFLVSTTRGLVRVRDGQLRAIDAGRYPWVSGLRTIVQTDSGDSWLQDVNVISRLSSADLDRAFDRPGSPLTPRLFDVRDGLANSTQRAGVTGPQAVAGGDGRIWFATSGGLVSIDARHLARIAPPASAAIRSLAAGTKIYRDPRDVVLAPGTTSVRVTFMAASLGTPDRVRFRYKLDGVDEDWVESGTRRATNYTNLGPGRFRFQVVAGDDTGAWSPRGGVVEFEIEPTFTQSWPFRFLCALGGLALIWLAYRLRIRAVAAQVSARLAERHDERERIARELHDTLLQSVQALMLRVEHATSMLPPDQPARKGLVDALDRAQDVVAQGRDHVRALRPAVIVDDLAVTLGDLVSAQGFDPPLADTIRTNGVPRPLAPSAAEQIARIANEALFNIRRHAQAERIAIDVRYGADALIVRIADNGVGIDPDVLRAGMRTGHYGLIGMRERAQRIGADLIFDNAADGGAEVTLIVPTRKAYAREDTWRARARHWRSRFRPR